MRLRRTKSGFSPTLKWAVCAASSLVGSRYCGYEHLMEHCLGPRRMAVTLGDETICGRICLAVYLGSDRQSLAVTYSDIIRRNPTRLGTTSCGPAGPSIYRSQAIIKPFSARCDLPAKATAASSSLDATAEQSICRARTSGGYRSGHVYCRRIGGNANSFVVSSRRSCGQQPVILLNRGDGTFKAEIYRWQAGVSIGTIEDLVVSSGVMDCQRLHRSDDGTFLRSRTRRRRR